MARFSETVDISPINARTGGVELGMSIAARLDAFDNQIESMATRAAVTRGKQRAGQVVLEKDSNGLTKPPKYDKVGILGEVEAEAHNKSLLAAYVASVDQDISANVARLQATYSDDIIKFNDAAEAYRAATLDSLDPQIRQDASILLADKIGSAGIRVQSADYKRQKEEAYEVLKAQEDNLANEAEMAAYGGDLAESAVSILKYNANIDSQVESGHLDLDEAETKKRAVHLKASNANIIGGVRRMTAAKDYMGALKQLRDLDKEVPKGRTLGEHADLVNMVKGEIYEAISMDEKIETLEAEKIEEDQEDYFYTLFEGIIDPEKAGFFTTETDLIQAGREKNITEKQTTALVNVLNNRGLGVNDWLYISQINRAIDESRDPRAIKELIASGTGRHITTKKANELMIRLRESTTSESPLKSNKSARAVKMMRGFLIQTGMYGAIDFDQQQNYEIAKVEYDQRVLAGENPLFVAKELVLRKKTSELELPKTANLDDLPGSLKKLEENRENMKKAEYNAEVGRIEDLMELMRLEDEFNRILKNEGQIDKKQGE